MVQMKKAGMAVLAVLLSAGMAATAAGAEYREEKASSYSARFYTEDEYDNSEDRDSGGYDHTKDKEAQLDAANGPGAAPAAEDTVSAEMGPSIREVTMREQHHEEYGLYEESIEGKFFLYANVSNGGVTDEPAYLEIPAGLDYRAEKDGVPISYASGQSVGEKGTYVIYITAIEDKNVPLSQQTELRTVFRFRIDDKRAELKGALGDGISAVGEAAGGSSGLPQGYVEGGLEALLDAAGQETPGETGTEPALEQEEIPTEGTDAGGTQAAEEDGKEETAADTRETDDGVPSADEPADRGRQDKKRSQIYQPEDSMYRVTMENGFTFLISVPEGMVTTSSVTYRADDGYQMYHNGEELENGAEPGSLVRLQAYGKYRLASEGYEYPFEITDTYVKLDAYSAPVGMRITEASYEGKELDTGSGKQVLMTEDGDYLFTLKGEEGQKEELGLTRDTIAPEVTVDVGRQKAAITYIAEDIAGITLSRNGGEPQTFNGVEVSSPGRYILTVTDRAGNVAVSEFALRYHMNVYALFAVILCVAGTAAAAVILIRKKKNLTVR